MQEDKAHEMNLLILFSQGVCGGRRLVETRTSALAIMHLLRLDATAVILQPPICLWPWSCWVGPLNVSRGVQQAQRSAGTTKEAG